jgi:hypothetical protein
MGLIQDPSVHVNWGCDTSKLTVIHRPCFFNRAWSTKIHRLVHVNWGLTHQVTIIHPFFLSIEAWSTQDPSSSSCQLNWHIQIDKESPPIISMSNPPRSIVWSCQFERPHPKLTIIHRPCYFNGLNPQDHPSISCQLVLTHPNWHWPPYLISMSLSTKIHRLFHVSEGLEHIQIDIDPPSMLFQWNVHQIHRLVHVNWAWHIQIDSNPPPCFQWGLIDQIIV